MMKSIAIISAIIASLNLVTSAELTREKVTTGVKLNVACTAGSYVNGSECTPCPIGKYSNVAGALSCTNCASGYFMAGTGRTACNQVAAGNKATGFNIEDSTGATGWVGCGVNKYSAAGATICQYCDAGKFAAMPGVISNGPTACLDCQAGSYGLGVAAGCASCPAGKFVNTVGSTFCNNCPAGTFSVAGATACTSCPSGFSSNNAGSSECLSCATGNCNVLESQYVGCYKDDDKRDVRNFVGYVNSLKSCQNLCSGYSYFSLQHGNQCFCGNAYATAVQYSQLADSVCRYYTIPNGGNTMLPAGQEYYINAIYRNINYVGPANVPVTVVVPDVPVEARSQVSSSQYLGCFVDDNMRDVRNYNGRVDTDVAQCQDKCDGFIFFAVQFGGECFCGNSYASSSYYRQVSDSECSDMNGGRSQYWGGNFRNAVYRHA